VNKACANTVRSIAKDGPDALYVGPLAGAIATKVRQDPMPGTLSVADIRASIVDGIMKHKEEVLDQVERGLAKGLDVPQLVEKKVAAFAVDKLEALILEVASRELRAIEWLGGVLGVLIGVLQVAFLWWRG
jgi:uncharacterized membrane protein YheB (UPF0754 family)